MKVLDFHGNLWAEKQEKANERYNQGVGEQIGETLAEPADAIPTHQSVSY